MGTESERTENRVRRLYGGLSFEDQQIKQTERTFKKAAAVRVAHIRSSAVLTVDGVQTGVGEKLSILKQCSKLAPCDRLSRPKASQPRLDYSAHPP